ncbi:permeases of the major facilitator superfamily [Moorella thermoacetica Y72]|uniref:Putative proline/betaine transporter n=1 Tax=Moorella thermoacetica Y72 TaxID=1325331 RepID=A0A0S6UEB3_NEOTH|nr:MFS transporter [Moorella thermoacetica]GAF25323.1 permeases of the major facilitator superfamily [Moorella thermoacetica Y72]
MNESDKISSNSSIRAIVAGGAGIILEWFDYGIYGTFAPIISEIFFPSYDPIVSILLTLLVFGVGFIARPVGSAVFGYVGDKYGRKVSLAWTIIIMAVATTLIGFIPPYATIGVVAPIILTCCRLVQGLSAGGEWGSATAFLVEYAPENRRGFYGSFQQNLAVVGLTLGTLIGFIVTNNLGKEALYSWGWRIPFILGIILGYVGWYIRNKLEDTPFFTKVEKTHEVLGNPLLESLNKANMSGIIKVMGISLGWNAGFYILMTFMSSYTTTVLKLPFRLSLLSSLFSFILFIILMPVMGLISDKIGRKPVLISGCLGFMVFTYPVFLFMADGSFMKVLLGEFVIAFFQSMFSGVAVAFVAEVFTTQVRVSSLVGYNIAAALSGGMGPFFATYIIKVTGNISSPAYYLIGLVIFTLIAVATLPETYNKPLG